MLFNSFEYLLFFPTVACLYFLIPPRFRWALLLAASYCFYMAWKPAYAALLLTSTLVDYFAARAMGATSSRRGRLACLIVSLTVNLGLLFTFKYFNFFTTALEHGLATLGYYYSAPASNFLLPVGISFYTFQTLGYSIDVFRGNQKPERHFGHFALYVSFFPQLVAGPIERARNLLPQLRQTHRFDYDRVVQGGRLILWGLFKKVVIADRLAVFVDAIYDSPTAHPGPLLTLATLCFAYQIYCDFSGYSDIAIGSARVLGIKLMTNFNRPYHARSLTEFWERWHISLSTWFRDYLYIPLGGNRVTLRRTHLNLLIVFTLSGLWHGASWTFILWGLIHALFYIASRITSRLRANLIRITRLARQPRLHALLQWTLTFTIVNLAWIFFRANSLPDALHILTHLHTGWETLLAPHPLRDLTLAVSIPLSKLIVMTGATALLCIVEAHQPGETIDSALAPRPPWQRWSAYLFLTLAIMNAGVTHEVPFVYFQF